MPRSMLLHYNIHAVDIQRIYIQSICMQIIRVYCIYAIHFFLGMFTTRKQTIILKHPMPNMESDAATDSVKQGATNMEDLYGDPVIESSILQSHKHGKD